MPWLSVLVTWRLRRISTRGYVGKGQRCTLVKRLFEISNPGVVGERLNISLARCLEFLLRLKKILIEGPAKPYQNSEEI